MKTLLIVTLGAALVGGGCGADVSGSADPSLTAEAGSAAEDSSQRPAGRRAAAPRPSFRDATIPAGTTLSLALTSAIASDTSAVEDTVTAELTRAITIDGRELLPAGTRVTGS